MCQEYDELLCENPEVGIMVKVVLLGLAVAIDSSAPWPGSGGALGTALSWAFSLFVHCQLQRNYCRPGC